MAAPYAKLEATDDNPTFQKLESVTADAERKMNLAACRANRTTVALKKWNRSWLRNVLPFEGRRRERKLEKRREHHHDLMEYSLLAMRIYSACLVEEETRQEEKRR